MNIAVCVKQVPGPDEPPALEPPAYRLGRDVKPVLDEPDTYGVEVALSLAEAATAAGDPSSVTAVSMGPAGDLSGVRSALAMGAAAAVVVDDPALEGSDALVTARVLAALCRRVSASVVVCATESSDGYTGTVPAQLATLLEVPALTFARRAVLEGGELRVERQTERGVELLACAPPAVVAVTAGAIEPRYPSLRNILAAKSKPVERCSLTDLGLAPSSVGWDGARQAIRAVAPVPERAGGTVVVDDGTAHEAILSFLADLGRR